MVKSSAIRDLLELTERPGVISLAGGLPNPSTFPVDAIARAAAAALADDPTGALQYGPTDGYRPLRAWVAATHHGATGDQVLVTHGSQQALELVARAVVPSGGTVALADPAYVGALQAFATVGATLAPIPSDADGLRVDLLAEQLAAGARPALVYVVANFDNPTGATLAPRRRLELAALADRYGFWIVDDDPYGALRWRGTQPVALRDLSDRVVTLGSASKILSPGLRVGWAVAPAEVIATMAVHKQSADLHTGSLNQRIVHGVLAEPGFLDAHLRRLRAGYLAQATALRHALGERLGNQIELSTPDGGMFLWASLTDAVDPALDTDALLAEALRHDTAFVPASAFAAGHPARLRRHLRLSFATGSPDQLREAADRLAAALWRATGRAAE